jgi:hypothetical protein
VAEAGSNNPEVVQARGTYPLLNDRITNAETQLAQSAWDNPVERTIHAAPTGKAWSISNLSTDDIATLIDIYSKANADGTFDKGTSLAMAIHQYRKSGIGLQIDHTNIGTLLSLTNAHNPNYGDQYGSADFINLYNTQLPIISGTYNSKILQVDKFGYMNFFNWAIMKLAWDEANNNSGFVINTGANWVNAISKLQTWQNNGVNKAYMLADGSLFIKQLVVDARSIPALLNGWVNYGGGNTDASYWIDKEGMVHLEGMVKSGTINSPIFNLPVGYRPPGNKYFAVNSNSAFGSVIVGSNGDVTCNVGNNAFVSLDGISFRI